MTNREDLYDAATEAYNAAAEAQAARAPLGSRDTDPWRDGIRSVVDLALDAHLEPTRHEAREVLREAAEVVRHLGQDPAISLKDVLDIDDYLTRQADRLEAEHQAAQEKAEREAEREKLVEQAARATFEYTVGDEWESISEAHREHYRAAARKVRDILAAPTTDGGEA